MSGDLIFVYGTLRKDSGSEMSRLLRRGTTAGLERVLSGDYFSHVHERV